jgi:predicted solute-binding protein
VASFGPVLSVFLAHRTPLSDLRRIHCDTASLASVNLLRVLLAERGLTPEFLPLPPGTPPETLDAFMLIGDPALAFIRRPHDHVILDLGADWRDLTGLPFIFAAWVLRRSAETRELRSELLAAAARGRRELETILRTRTEFDEPFRRTYLTRHIRNEMGPAEKAGLARFVELLRKHVDRPVHDPRYA